jgi:hypothetical protein
MLLETTATDVTWYSILALLMPVIIVVVKYLLNLSSTQKLIQKSGQQDLINNLAVTAIDSAEKWAMSVAKKADGDASPTSADKKSMAAKFLLEQGKAYGLPAAILNENMVSGVIEALLLERDDTLK